MNITCIKLKQIQAFYYLLGSHYKEKKCKIICFKPASEKNQNFCQKSIGFTAGVSPIPKKRIKKKLLFRNCIKNFVKSFSSFIPKCSMRKSVIRLWRFPMLSSAYVIPNGLQACMSGCQKQKMINNTASNKNTNNNKINNEQQRKKLQKSIRQNDKTRNNNRQITFDHTKVPQYLSLSWIYSMFYEQSDINFILSWFILATKKKN